MKQILKFSSPGCRPCKMMSPIINEVAQELGLRVVELDTVDDRDAVDQFEVMAAPTYILLDGNSVVEKHVGMASKEELLEKFNK